MPRSMFSFRPRTTFPDRPRLESELDQIADTIYHYDLEGLGAAASEQARWFTTSPRSTAFST